jgi:hypothetical protein
MIDDESAFVDKKSKMMRSPTRRVKKEMEFNEQENDEPENTKKSHVVVFQNDEEELSAMDRENLRK